MAPKARAQIGEDAAQFAALCKALAHPARVAILQFLLERKSCVCGEIVDVLPLAQSTVSEHLRVLKEAGLIRGTIEGPRVCYCANEPVVRQLQEHFGALATLLK